MQLPAIPDLPIPPLGIDIPTLIHPPLVHFAIVLPIVVLLLEIYNLFVRRRSISVFSFLLLLVMIAVFVGAWITGKNDGTEAFDMLSDDGKALLKAHKLIGTYLVYGSGILLLFKIFAMSFKGWKSTFLYILLLIGFVGGTLYQGKEGGELVFEQGANNAKVQSLSEQISDLKDDMEDLKSDLQEAKEAAAAKQEQKQQAQPNAQEEQPAAKPAEENKPQAEESEEKEEPKAADTQEEKPAASDENEAKQSDQNATPAATPAQSSESEEKPAATQESNATQE